MIDPLGLSMKRTRLGLGLEDLEPMKKFAKTTNNSDDPIISDDKIQEYQNIMRDKFRESKVNGQLKAIVSICYDLDEKEQIDDNDILPTQFLPKHVLQEDNENSEEIPMSVIFFFSLFLIFFSKFLFV